MGSGLAAGDGKPLTPQEQPEVSSQVQQPGSAAASRRNGAAIVSTEQYRADYGSPRETSLRTPAPHPVETLNFLPR
jgi:hypothetical protein